MIGRSKRTARRALVSNSGQVLVEFAFVAFLTVIMVLFVFEMSRMLLVYVTVADAAREGVRYAIVHGSTRSSGASGPTNDPADVIAVVTNFASSGLLTTSRLVIHVTYTGGSNDPGSPVNITVVYPYDPLVTYFSQTVRLGSVSQGIIVF